MKNLYHEFTINYYINKFGIKKGTKLFNKKLKNKFSLEYYIYTYDNPIEKYNNDKQFFNRPQTLEYNILKYGEEEGTKKYNEKLINRINANKKRGASLKNYIEKYGEEEGTKKYNELCKKHKGKGNLQYYIEKYGEEEGTKRYNEKRKICAGNLKNYIEKYGEEEGTKKYNEFRKKCGRAFSIERYIEKYGEDGINLYNDAKLKQKINSNTNINYYLNKGYTFDDAKLLLYKRQCTSTLSKFQEKYGIEEGTKKYLNVNKSKSVSLKSYIEKYGEEEGTKKYNNLILSQQGKGNLQYYIKKYGEEEGTKRYNEILRKRISHNISPHSKIADKFCKDVIYHIMNNNIKLKFDEIYCIDNEFIFYTNSLTNGEFKYIKVDFYIKELNLVVEFYGDYWHGFNIKDQEKQKKIFDRDNKRINCLKKFFGCDILIIWEHEYRNNQEQTIEIVMNKIKNKIKNKV